MSRPAIALDARLASSASTGDSTYWTGLLHGLSRVKSEFLYLLVSNARRPAGIPDCDAFRWITVPSPTQRWWSLVKFPLAARRLGAKAMHTQYSISPLVGKAGITTIHDVSFFIGPEWFRPKDRMLLRRSVPGSVARAARVITVSETSRSDIERFIPQSASKTSVTPLAGHPLVAPMERHKAASIVRGSLGVSGPYLLTVGTRWPRKNMALAVEAAQLLPQQMPHKLAVTGKPGWGREELGERSFATGYVSFGQLSALYCAADLYLAPSRHEGFGIPIIEAFSCACPVVCSTGGALPETAGDAAHIERSWEPKDWAASIRSLLSDSSKLDDLRARGLQRAASFTWEETARKTLEVYREVAT